jgi:hypothetical protein
VAEHAFSSAFYLIGVTSEIIRAASCCVSRVVRIGVYSFGATTSYRVHVLHGVLLSGSECSHAASVSTSRRRTNVSASDARSHDAADESCKLRSVRLFFK